MASNRSRRFLIPVAAAALALAVACASRTAKPGTTAAASLPRFDSSSAWRYLEAQLAFGPRPVGVPAHEQLKEYMASELKKSSADVQLQQWTDPAIQLPCTNVIARFPGKGSGSVLLAAHWDTSLAPAEAAEKCGAPIAWKSIATMPIEPD